MFNQDPDRNVGFLLHDVSRLIRKRFDRRARALGITRAQWRVLVHLAPRQGINQSTLSDILELDNVTLGRHIDRLEDTGWLERRPDPGDRRAWRLFLSDKARPLLDQMEALAIRTQAEALTGISVAELDRLMSTLMSIKRNILGKEDEGDGSEESGPGPNGGGRRRGVKRRGAARDDDRPRAAEAAQAPPEGDAPRGEAGRGAGSHGTRRTGRRAAAAAALGEAKDAG